MGKRFTSDSILANVLKNHLFKEQKVMRGASLSRQKSGIVYISRCKLIKNAIKYILINNNPVVIILVNRGRLGLKW